MGVSRNVLRASATGLALGALVACESAPITGRNQLILLPESQDAALGLDAWQQIKQQQPVANDSRLQQRVERVGRRIAEASGEPGWDWQFTLFRNDEPNAFALPGGKVGVNTGLFKVVENEDQLAAVMGTSFDAYASGAQHTQRYERVTQRIRIALLP